LPSITPEEAEFTFSDRHPQPIEDRFTAIADQALFC